MLRTPRGASPAATLLVALLMLVGCAPRPEPPDPPGARALRERLVLVVTATEDGDRLHPVRPSVGVPLAGGGVLAVLPAGDVRVSAFVFEDGRWVGRRATPRLSTGTLARLEIDGIKGAFRPAVGQAAWVVTVRGEAGLWDDRALQVAAATDQLPKRAAVFTASYGLIGLTDGRGQLHPVVTSSTP